MTISCKYVVIFPRLQRKVVKIMKQNTFNQWKREKCFHLSANHFPIMQTVCLHFPVIVYRKHSDRYTVVVVVVFIVISDSCVTDHRTSARVRLPPITQPESSSVRAISEREIKWDIHSLGYQQSISQLSQSFPFTCRYLPVCRGLWLLISPTVAGVDPESECAYNRSSFFHRSEWNIFKSCNVQLNGVGKTPDVIMM